MMPAPRPAPKPAPRSTRISGLISGGLGRAVLDGRDPGVAGAVGAAEEAAARLHAVPHHFATAVLARGGQAVDGALEGVECVVGAGHVDMEGLVVIVTTDLA